MLGKEGIEHTFGRKFANHFNIHRTRGNFPNDGIDTFPAMARKGIQIVDRVVQEELGGRVEPERDRWLIPRLGTTNKPNNELKP